MVAARKRRLLLLLLLLSTPCLLLSLLMLPPPGAGGPGPGLAAVTDAVRHNKVAVRSAIPEGMGVR